MESDMKWIHFRFGIFVVFVCCFSVLFSESVAQVPQGLQSGSYLPPMGAFMGDPQTLTQRLTQQMRRCANLEPTAEVYDRVGCLFVQFVNLQAVGNQAEAARAVEHALELLDREGDAFGIVMLRNLLGETALLQGQNDEAARQLREAAHLLDEIENTGAQLRLGFVASMAALLSPEMAKFIKQSAPFMESMAPTYLIMARSRVHQAYGNALAAQGQLEEAGRQWELAQDAQKRALGGMTIQQQPLAIGGQQISLGGQQLPLGGQQILSENHTIRTPTAPPGTNPGPAQLQGSPRSQDQASPTKSESVQGFMTLYMHGASAQMAGDFDQAIRYLEKALAQIDDDESSGLDLEQVESLKAKVLFDLGRVYTDLGLRKKANDLFQQANEHARQGNDANLVKLIELAMENLRDESDTFKNSDKQDSPRPPHVIIREQIDNTQMDKRSRMAANMVQRSVRFHEEKRYREAIPLVTKARSIYKEMGNKPAELETASLMAGFYLLESRFRDALAPTLQAVDLLESILTEIQDAGLRSDFLSRRESVYSAAVSILRATGQLEKAFAYSERARSRALLNLLGNRAPDLARGVDSRKIQKLHEVRREMAEIERNWRQLGLGENKKLELENLRHKEEDLILEIKIANAEYASLISVDPINIKTLQSQVLEEDVTLVSYFVTNEGWILTWVVDQEHSEETPTIHFEDLSDDVLRFKDLLEGRDSDDAVAEELYRKLITPLKPYLRHRNLVIVAHKQLHYVPFAALKDPETGRFLVEDYNLAYAPSASVLRYLREKRSPLDGEALILGDPTADLKYAESGARMAADLFGVHPLIGQDATETAVRARAGSIDLLHLGAHGFYNTKMPHRSHIVLAGDNTHDGRLEVQELFDEVDLTGVNLVVLSACETAQGGHRGGDDFIGLTRAFLYSGSPAVISTLWAVDDKASAELTGKFYCRLFEGATTGEALAQAQRDLLNTEMFAEPYYWAAFRLSGDHSQAWPDSRTNTSPCSNI